METPPMNKEPFDRGEKIALGIVLFILAIAVGTFGVIIWAFIKLVNWVTGLG